MAQPTDIVMLTHNRLEHLVATVDALEARTTAPYRLTIVDNASGPDVRNWLQANRARLHQLILMDHNLYPGSSGPALQIGIDATTSDPVVATDPDLVVPDLDPCWLTRMLDILHRHEDFGLLGIGLDQSNLPALTAPEHIEPHEIIDGEIVERAVGSIFTFIRRAALHSYYDDWRACESVKRAGYRYGWALNVRAFHLGWDDFELYPGHLASKLHYGADYREVNLIARPPTLAELAIAGPVISETRRLDVPDGSVLELAWSGDPPVAASVPGVVAVQRPEAGELPFDDASAGVVVLMGPPRDGIDELLNEACRVACRAVIALAPLATFAGRAADELSPTGWSGREQSGPGDLPFGLASAADAVDVGVSTLDHRESWLDLFARGAFGGGDRRLWVWEARKPRPIPDRVLINPDRVTPWEAVALPPQRRLRPLTVRVQDRARQGARIAIETARARRQSLTRRIGTARVRPPRARTDE